MVSFTDSATPATEAEICRFEAFIGHRLPDEYRDFLKKTNGGAPQPCSFRESDSSLNRVLFLYPLATTHSQGLEYEFVVYQGELPDGFLAIGTDIGAEPICLCLNRDDHGAVYGSDGLVEDTGEPVAMRRFASSFGLFLKSLFVTEEEREELERQARDHVSIFATTGKPQELSAYLAQGHTFEEKCLRGLNLIQCAAAAGNLELVNECLNRGVSPSCAVHQALLNRRWEVAKHLAEAGVDLNERDQRGERPLQLIFGIYGKACEDLEAFLMARGAR